MNGKNYEVNPIFKVNDKVRISKFKRAFQKGYLPNWTNNEVFTVVLAWNILYISNHFSLQDSIGDILKGGFYEHELSKSKTVDVYESRKYCVERE